MMTPDDVPFDEAWADSAPTDSAAVAQTLTVLAYAVQANPDEHWDACCVCGCSGNCSSYDALDHGLLLLGDMTLCRAAWCHALTCSGEKYSSIYISWKVKS